MNNKKQHKGRVYMSIMQDGSITFSMELEEIGKYFGIPKELVRQYIKTNDESFIGPLIDFFGMTLATMSKQVGFRYSESGYNVKYVLENNEVFKINFAGDFGNDVDIDDEYSEDEYEDDIDNEELKEIISEFVDNVVEHIFSGEETKTSSVESPMPFSAVICSTFGETGAACKLLKVLGVKKADLLKNSCGEYIIYIKDEIDENTRTRFANIINGEYNYAYYADDNDIKNVIAWAEEHGEVIIKDNAIGILA